MRSLLFPIFALLLNSLPTEAASQASSLACKINLLQAKGGRPLGMNVQVLEPRTNEGQQFSSFNLDLQKVGDEAWLHQNLCVSRNDFLGGRFAGMLCVVVMTAPESEQASGTSALTVDISRVESKSPTVGGETPAIGGASLGGLRVAVPIDAQGRSASITQFIPALKGRRELLKIEISCGT